jgi:pyruvate dehydrogenase E2 component (dihydrolipoamide acetyltransferase)
MNLGAKALAEAPAAAAPTKPDWPSLPDFEKFGPVRREKMSNLRGIISDRMSMCWNRIPHVFQFNEVDLTSLGEVQARYKDDFKAKGSSVSPTNFIIKAMAICLKEFPQFNASLDEESGEIIYKDYVNIGVAVDTPTGLIVPVLKNVDQLSIFQIGKDLKDLAKKTRDRKVTQEDLSGGGMTLSNLGGIGGTHFTPIVNWPEVAILGVGRGEVKPKYINGEVVPRNCTQMTLSYDHRVIDGADGARFMVRLTEILENIERTLLGG